MKKYAYLPGFLLVAGAVVRAMITLTWDGPGLAALGTGVFVVGVGAALNWHEIREWFRDPRGVFAVNTSLSMAVLVAILVLLNMAAVRQPVDIDLTAAGRNTLTPGTAAFLARLDRDVSLDEFGRVRDPQIQQLLSSFARASERVRLSFVDYERAPQRARDYGILRAGTVLVSSGDKFRKVETVTEPALVTAILQVMSDEQATVCFTTGHGEHGLADEGSAGLSRLGSLLHTSNFRIERVSLLTGPVPGHCSALVIAGPAEDPVAEEALRLTEYLRSGGRVALLLDAPPRSAFRRWAREWGVTSEDGTVVDTSGAGQTVGGTPETPLGLAYGNHAITRGFELATLYDGVRPLGAGPSQYGGEPVSLVQTGPTTYVRPDGPTVNVSAGRRPLNIAIATSAAAAAGGDRLSDQARLVVFGDADFVANGVLGRQGNRDLILRTVSWLVGEADAMVVNVGERQNRRVELTRQVSTAMYIVNLAVLPLLPIVAGVIVFIRGRR